VAEALIDGGADIEAPDGSIGTPLDNAVGYSCWHVARLLVARGTRVDKAWHAAALGMLSRLEELLGSDPPAQDVSQAFWHACAGSQRRAAGAGGPGVVAAAETWPGSCWCPRRAGAACRGRADAPLAHR